MLRLLIEAIQDIMHRRRVERRLHELRRLRERAGGGCFFCAFGAWERQPRCEGHP
jgi:hypothetical protein